ncbi:sugar ABC transporter ATP-binding protein [Oricola sp.]|uniref:sugar ABC transporter ATP-binding protein n=1 Tax=Oricola sp. TaxID=1979950 RepID=UPI003BAB43A8
MSEPFIQIAGLSKSYGATKALEDVAFECRRGEIHAILGENGAGKSTLMKILSGVVQPDSGNIRIDGNSERFGTPRQAQMSGVICMFQELSLSADLSVAENILLGAPETRSGFLPSHRYRDMRDLLDRIGGDSIDLNTRTSALALPERQQVEIVKALMRRPRLLILDEATSALSKTVVDKVFAVLREAVAAGAAVLFISHRLHEIEVIADRITVFRNGQNVGTFDAGAHSQDEIVALMVGRRITELFPAKPARDPGEVILEVSGLSWLPGMEAIDLCVHRGEIVGIGGLDGQGQKALMMALFGVLKGVDGSFRTQSADRLPVSPRDAKSARFRLALAPEDRKTEGLVTAMSIEDNLRLPALGLKGALANGRGAEDEFKTLIGELELKYAHMEQPVSGLSGGNQQKIALMKWLALSPSCFLLIDPTRGIDVKTKTQIYRLLRRVADDGMAVILLSTDYEELVRLCDVVHIFYGGRINRTLSGDSLSPDAVIAASLNLPTERADA